MGNDVGLSVDDSVGAKEIAVPCEVGDRLKGFGRFDWVVLDLSDDKKRALIITEGIVRNAMPYNHRKWMKPTVWKLCSLRTYLNRQFFQSFKRIEQNCIAEEKNDNFKNSLHGTFGGCKTKDNIYLLSLEEAVRYLPYEQDRIAKSKEKSCDEPEISRAWWLRSPGKKLRMAVVVDANGEIKHDTHVDNGQKGVRPVLWVRLDELALYGYKFEPKSALSPGSN